MYLPQFTAEQSLGASINNYQSSNLQTQNSGITPQACSLGKKIACGAAFLACGASCALGPEICLPCLAAVGATDCLDCLLDW